MTRNRQTGFISRLYIGLLAAIFGVIILHAPISVYLGTVFPDLILIIKSWKEILILIAGLLAIYLLYKNKQFAILKAPVLILSAIYALIHLVCISLSVNLNSVLAGLAIDLRYILFFDLVYIASLLYPNSRKLFIKIGVIGAVVALGFAMLQVFVLPKDVLKYIGYSENTITSYLTVDQNENYIRINSTFRGPNPLGAYAMMVLSLILAAVVARFRLIAKNRKLVIGLSILSLVSLVALWSSYSRSALLAMLISIFILFMVLILKRKIPKKILAAIGLITLLSCSGLFILRDTDFVSNVLLHENPADLNDINSNEGHVSSLIDGWNRFVTQPFGGGIGSTGSASLFTDKPLIIENQYLFIAHEVGWLGLVIFAAIYALLLTNFWQSRNDWLALGLLASGVGLFVIGLLLPVWVDDTISIIWWGLAAIIMAGSVKIKRHAD